MAAVKSPDSRKILSRDRSRYVSEYFEYNALTRWTIKRPRGLHWRFQARDLSEYEDNWQSPPRATFAPVFGAKANPRRRRVAVALSRVAPWILTAGQRVTTRAREYRSVINSYSGCTHRVWSGRHAAG